MMSYIPHYIICLLAAGLGIYLMGFSVAGLLVLVGSLGAVTCTIFEAVRRLITHKEKK